MQKHPTKIDVQLLDRFQEFQDFKTRSREAQKSAKLSTATKSETEVTTNLATPDELLRTTIADLDAALAGELLDRVLAAPPAFFENLIDGTAMRPKPRELLKPAEMG